MDNPASSRVEASTRIDVTRSPPERVVSDRWQTGAFVGHYELIRQIGRGGMGVVYLARDTQLGRRVAIKFLSTKYLEEADRFMREARATARCQHPNIVVIHAVSRLPDGVPYMVLEYLEGSPLSLHLADRPLSVPKVVELTVPVVRALQRAHAEGIVHRDLKPGNVFVTNTGEVKVLDFGLAKALGRDNDPIGPRISADGDSPLTTMEDETLTVPGSQLGTVRYMSPEQWGADTIDARTDLWAAGILMYRMVSGRHPLSELTREQLRASAYELDDGVPSVGEAVPDLPGDFVAVVDRCLQKRKAARFADATELLEALESLLPGRYGRSLARDECPYPGLSAFQNSDADRFFGRAAEVKRALARVRERPMLAIVGPSGLGKSSLVRAGLMPALRNSGDPWEMFTIRPGRQPLVSLAGLCQSLGTSRSSATGQDGDGAEDEDERTMVEQLRSEPGLVGARLRARARQTQCRVLLFVDQFEELYTLVGDARERDAFASALLGLADDPTSPLRLVVSMRSDFLDRIAEHPGLTEEMTRGLMLLPAMDRAALRAALTQPAALAGYHFEDEAMVDDMLEVLQTTPGALSLLQFTASRLWDTRDREAKVFTRRSYEDIGGIEGILAAHADATLASMTPARQLLARRIFQRLVTPERTRAIVDLSELAEMTDSGGEVRRVVDQLVESRLLVSGGRSDGTDGSVELVHESLISSWPTLRRWLEESAEEEAFLVQLRQAARQWDKRDRPPGLLWRGDALEEARRFFARLRSELPPRETQYLDAAFSLADRSTRLRRWLIGGAFVVLVGLVVGAGVALVQIRKAEKASREAERVARRSEQQAREQAELAQQETQRAQTAESKIGEQLELLRTEQSARATAESKATDAAKDLAVSNDELAKSNDELAKSNQRLGSALQEAERAANAAAAATEAEKELSKRLEKLLDKERQRVKELEHKRGKIIDDLR